MGGAPTPPYVRWLVLAVLSVAYFGISMEYNTPFAVELELRSKYALSDPQLSLLFAVYNAPNIVLPALAGLFSDKVGSSNASVLSGVVVLVGAVLCAVGVQQALFPLLVVGRSVVGVGSEAAYIVFDSVLVEYFPLQLLSLAFGLYSLAGRSGDIVSFVALPTNTAVVAFWVSVGCIALAVLGLLLAHFVTQRRRPTHRVESGGEETEDEESAVGPDTHLLTGQRQGWAQQFRAWLRDVVGGLRTFGWRFYLLACFIYPLYYGLLYSSLGFLPLMVHSRYPLSTESSAMVVGTVGGTALVLTPLFGLMAIRVPALCEWGVPAAALVMVTSFVALLLEVGSEVVWSMWLGLALFGVSYAAQSASIFSAIASYFNSDAEHRFYGFAFGMAASATNLSGFLLNVGTGELLKAYDTRVLLMLWLAMAVIVLIMSAVWLVAHKRRGRGAVVSEVKLTRGVVQEVDREVESEFG